MEPADDVARRSRPHRDEMSGDMTVYVGTSGWHYKHWANAFYPKGVGQSKWLGYYAERFHTVEVNNAFYRLPEASTFERWRDATPDDFVVGLKASRYLTHVKRLKEPAEPVQPATPKTLTKKQTSSAAPKRFGRSCRTRPLVIPKQRCV